MTGHARDIVTGDMPGKPEIVGQARVTLDVSPMREIRALDAEPGWPELARMVGVRGGGHSRTVLAEIVDHADQVSSPFHLLLDDFAGASLVAGWVWSRWSDDWMTMPDGSPRKVMGMKGICTGFRPGASSLAADGSARHDNQSACPVVDLANPEDPDGFHTLERPDGVGMRRARWIDLWRDGDEIAIEAGFQDSGTAPEGGRVAVHEYRVRARASRDGERLIALEAVPHILPYRECPDAAGNVGRLIGAPLRQFRTHVLEVLPGTLGCTHLNDVLRALADVPFLARKLP